MYLNASPVLAFSHDASLSGFAHSWVIDKPKWRNGRRGGLKNRCPCGRGSSTLPFGTTLHNKSMFVAKWATRNEWPVCFADILPTLIFSRPDS